MKKLICSLLTCLLLVSAASAQHILKGKVTDADTGQPIAGVVVYLDGTSHTTTTDREGYFSMQVPERSMANLIYSHVAYRLTVMPNPFSQTDQSTTMRPQTVTIKDVDVDGNAKQKRAYDYTRRMKAFQDMFLGTTDAGRSCEITNPEDIELVYDQANKTLLAYAAKPIRFVNKYLGYTVDFRLLEFKAQYFEDANDLDVFNTGESYFSGLTLFHDDAPDSPRINSNRLAVYSISPTAMFRHLARRQLYEATGFRFFTGNSMIKPDEYFEVTDTLGMALISIRPEQLERDAMSKRLPRGVVGSLYFTVGGTIEGNNPRSDTIISHDPTNPRRATRSDDFIDMKHLSRIYFLTDKFFVDFNGNLLDPNVVRFAGEIGNAKAGDMLPEDYVPESTRSIRQQNRAARRGTAEEQGQQQEQQEQQED